MAKSREKISFYTSSLPLFLRENSINAFIVKKIEEPEKEKENSRWWIGAHLNDDNLKVVPFYFPKTNIFKLRTRDEKSSSYFRDRVLFINDNNKKFDLFLGSFYTFYLNKKDNSLLKYDISISLNLEDTFEQIPPVIMNIKGRNYYEKEWRWYNRFSACKKIRNIAEYLKENY